MSSTPPEVEKQEVQPEKQQDQPATNGSVSASAPPPKAGNSKGWIAVGGGFLLQFASFGYVNAIGVFQVEYEDNLLKGYNTSSISWILTFQLFLMFFLSQPVGLACDLFGPRWVTIPASICLVLGLIALSYCTEYYQVFLAQGVMFGIGAAGTFMPPLVVAAQHFQQKRALATGLTSVGSALGGVIYPVFFAQLFPKIGFGPAVRWSALLVGIVAFVGNCLIFPALEPKGWKARRAVFSFAALKHPPLAVYIIAAFFMFWAVFGPFTYLPVFALRYPKTRSVSLYTVSFINAGSVFGRSVPPYLSEKLGHLNTLTTFIWLSAISTLAIWLPINFYPSLAGLIIYSLVIGFSTGAFVGLMTACLVDVSSGQTGDLGMKLGTYMMIISFATLTGPPIQGAISDSDNMQLTFVIVFCGVSFLISAALFTLVTFWMRRAKRI